jgi:hypothetical protein
MLGTIYWICWAISLIVGAAMAGWRAPVIGDVGLLIVWAVMTFLLGWKIFGWPLTGKTD